MFSKWWVAVWFSHSQDTRILNGFVGCVQEFYPAGVYILRQGTRGDTFYLISQGEVKVTQTLPGHEVDDTIRVLSRGDYFGEQALLKEDKRTANIIAMQPGVECLTLDRESFIRLIGDLSELHERDYGDESRMALRNSTTSTANVFEKVDVKEGKLLTLSCFFVHVVA